MKLTPSSEKWKKWLLRLESIREAIISPGKCFFEWLTKAGENDRK